MNWASIRAEFPALCDWTWLNTATFGQIPTRTRRPVDAHFARREETACADFLQWFDDMDELRALIAQLIHCDARRYCIRNECGVSVVTVPRRHGVARWRPHRHLRDEFPNQYYFAASLAEQALN